MVGGMSTLLVRHAEVLVTMDGERREIRDGGLFARDGFVEQVGPTDSLPAHADETLDASGLIVLPGLVNTHHHLYQSLTRAVPGAQDAPLFEWLRALYPVWARLTPDDVDLSTRTGLLELAHSGCTTVFDHQYLWPNGSSVDDQVAAAHEVGVRFHVSRGSMSLGESKGGLPPDSVVEPEDQILDDCVRAIDAHHDPAPGSMTQVVLAPCSPFSVTTDLMLATAELAREKGVRLHTHLAETADEEAFCLERYGKRPVELAESVGWSGSDVWFAHGVFLDDDEIARMAEAGTGVAHCPTSNMRLASGIAPVAACLDAGVPVGLGVDGSASNDAGNLLSEARQAMLLARLAVSPPLGEGPQMAARTALELATIGGARLLGRPDIGSLEPGKCADFFALDLGRVEYAGALSDPVAAVLLCSPTPAVHTYVAANPIIADGTCTCIRHDGHWVDQHNRAAHRLVSGD
jgi:cytosine/adenosine deaminase-related metal-dependent hydrolase